jgi:hypothetical protein
MEIRDRIENNFTYHPPLDGQPEQYELIRYQAKQLAHLFVDQCPESRELSVALTKLEEAVMWVNAGIARNPEEPF